MKSMKSTIERTNEEEILKILVEQAPVGVCIMQDGKFCHINSYFSATTRYTLDELVGKDSFVIVFPEDSEAVRENTANPIRDAEGRVVSCLALARDVTKRKQIEETL
jgi:PAS domain-containing protein